MYNQSSVMIITILFILLILAMEAGYRLGSKATTSAVEAPRAQANAIQASLLGVLALLLGFTFSLSLQRYDSRSAAVVTEANAIGTTYLRAELLPDSMRSEVQILLRDYLELRVRESAIPLSNREGRQALLLEAGRVQNELWRYAVLASEEDKSPVTAGLFIQALNALIDSFSSRNAVLDRHVPEVVMILLFCTFLMTWGIVGYTSGVAGHRPSFVTYLMLVLIVLLVYIIIDLDRPRRGLIEIDHSSLYTLQAALDAAQDEDFR